MKKHVFRKRFIEIDVIDVNLSEKKVSRKHIKTEGFLQSLIVAVYSVLVLSAFKEIGNWFRSGIKGLIGILHKHNYFIWFFRIVVYLG